MGLSKSDVRSFLEFKDYYDRLFEKRAREERLEKAKEDARKQEALDKDIEHTLSSHAVGNSPEQISKIIDRPVSWVIETLKANGVVYLD